MTTNGNTVEIGARPCPQCRAQPGQPCRRPNGDRYITLVGTPKFHAKRARVTSPR